MADFEWELMADLQGDRGFEGRPGPRGLPGLEEVPTDPGIAELIEADSLTRAAIDTVIAETPPVADIALSPWRAALRGVDLKPARIVVIGDSVVEGRNATNIGVSRWVDRLRVALRIAYPASGIGSRGGVDYLPFFRVAPMTAAPFTVTGTLTTDFANGLGLKSVALTGNTVITGSVTGTSIDVLYLRGTGTRNFTVRVDGGAPATVSTGGSGAVADTGITRIVLGAAGTHTLEFAPSSGSLTSYLEGVIVYNDNESKGVQVLESGHSGYSTVDFEASTRIFDRVASLAPQHIILALGENDYLHGHTSVSYGARLGSIITKMRAAYNAVGLSLPNFSIIANFEANANGSNIEPWSNYVAAAREVARADTGGLYAFSAVRLIDISAKMPPILGDTGGFYGDNFHPNDKGHQYYGAYVHAAIG
jgi:lysophospholipase L1-like esterase